MSDYASYYGVSTNADLSPNLIQRPSSIPLSVRLPQMVADNGYYIIFALLFFNIGTMMYGIWLWDVLLLLSIMAYFYCKKHIINYPFRTPAFEFVKGKKEYGNGLFYMGNDRDNGAGLFFSDSDFRTHILAMGSTGSGKTRFLLSLLYQALLIGSGAIYVDGKADNSVFWWVYSICRRLNRADDLLIINYLTGGETINVGVNAGVRGNNSILTNTMNPFATGTAEQLRSMVVGLMRDSGGDGDMWKGRASSLLAGALRCLAYLRDQGIIQLSVSSIRDSLPLDNVLRLALGTYNQESEIMIGDNKIDLDKIKFPDYAIRPLKKYLLDLPGYNESSAKNDDIAPECYKQHGFLTMQLTESLGDLGETYGHIFNVPIGEVDFKDVVFNRRILFVMLPSLERDPDALANLGKLVVSGVRSALGPALGDKVEGSKRDVIDVKPTTSLVPFLLILDEYGYYSVKGFAVVAAQARSLGVGIIFAGQDYPSFKKGSPEEAASTVANTNIKICMKLEDPSETLDIFVKRVGQGYSPYTAGFERLEGKSSYSDQRNVQFKETARINVRDLVDQDPGQAHVIFKDVLVRANLFSMLTMKEAKRDKIQGLVEVKDAQLNRFLMVRPPSIERIEELKAQHSKISNSLIVDNKEQVASFKIKDGNDFTDSVIKSISLFIDESMERGFSSVESGIHAIARKMTVKDETPEQENSPIKDSDIDGTVDSHFKNEDNESDSDSLSVEKAFQKERLQRNRGSSFNNISDQLGIFHNEIDTDEVKKKINDFSINFETLINETLIDSGEKGNIRQILEDVAYDYYGDADESAKDADKAINMLDERLSYAAPPVPQKQSPKAVSAKIKSLMRTMAPISSDGNSSEQAKPDDGIKTIIKEAGIGGISSVGGLASDFDDNDSLLDKIIGGTNTPNQNDVSLMDSVELSGEEDEDALLNEILREGGGSGNLFDSFDDEDEEVF